MAVQMLHSDLLAGIVLGELEGYRVPGCPEYCVRPPSAVRWAIKNGCEVPVELKVLFGDSAKSSDRDLHPKERDSLLKLVIGMARGSYAYDSTSKRSEVAAQIARDLERNDVALDQDTIRKWLRIASELLPTAQELPP
jgi:hypothetical protein